MFILMKSVWHEFKAWLVFQSLFCSHTPFSYPSAFFFPLAYTLELFFFFQGHPTSIFHFKKHLKSDQRNVLLGLPPVHGSQQPPPSSPEHTVSPSNFLNSPVTPSLSFPLLSPWILGKSRFANNETPQSHHLGFPIPGHCSSLYSASSTCECK